MKGKSFTEKKGQVVGKESVKETSERKKSGREGNVRKQKKVITGNSKEWKKVKRGKS
jgi:hypothetical protein